MENNEKNRLRVSFAAIDPYLQSNIVSPVEREIHGRDLVEWGDGNAYPDYLLELSKTVPTLRSIINGTTDFITGDDLAIVPLAPAYGANIMNAKGDTLRSQVEALARDYCTYGGFALQVIRGRGGQPVEIYHLDLRFLRSNKDNSVFYYCERWKGAGRRKVLEYPAYQPVDEARWVQLTPEERARIAASVVYVKNVTTQVYPFPVYGAAVKACEIERGIDDYHLNALENGFTSSAIINFNNGTASDEMKEEIERNVNEKFGGHHNAGRIMCSWNPDKENATTIESVKVEDFGDRYAALSKHSRQQIFTAFRANPNLFGIPTESLGFSSEEYESAFRLYNRTVVRPAQRLICDTYDRIYGQAGVLTIKPFTLDEDTETNVQ